jgi:hypothetical protein
MKTRKMKTIMVAVWWNRILKKIAFKATTVLSLIFKALIISFS